MRGVSAQQRQQLVERFGAEIFERFHRAARRCVASRHSGCASSFADGTPMRSYIASIFAMISSFEYLPLVHESNHEVDVRFEKAQAVGGLNEVGVRPAAPFVNANQRRHVGDELRRGSVGGQPLSDDARAPIGMGLFVGAIVHHDGNGVRSAKGALHVVRERRKTHSVRCARRYPIEPFERFDEMGPVVRVVLFHPQAGPVDERRCHVYGWASVVIGRLCTSSTLLPRMHHSIS